MGREWDAPFDRTDTELNDSSSATTWREMNQEVWFTEQTTWAQPDNKRRVALRGHAKTGRLKRKKEKGDIRKFRHVSLRFWATNSTLRRWSQGHLHPQSASKFPLSVSTDRPITL
jgi:hypothetical protein